MAVNERGNAKKTTDAEEPVSRDTWPVPPPQSTVIVASGSAHDTIPTPPPDPNDDLADIEIPTLRGLDVQNALGTPDDDASADEKMEQEGAKGRSEI